MRHRLLLALLGLLSAAPANADGAANCTLRLMGSLPLGMTVQGHLTVPVVMNGKTVTMIVDTGAPSSMVSKRIARELDLPPHLIGNGEYFEGFSGQTDDQAVEVKRTSIAGISGPDITFYVDHLLNREGLLGSNLLANFDLDFDMAKAKLNLVSPDHCPGQVVYWTKQAYGAVPFTVKQHLKVKVQLDGKDIFALIDTGAPDTVMSLEWAAEHYGLDEKELKNSKSRLHSFNTLTIAEVNVGNPRVRLASNDDTDFLGGGESKPKMIVGMNVLRRLHFYVSYKEQMIYVTPATQY